MPKKLTGPELVDEIAKEPNLDMFFDRNPKTISDEELLELIEIERGRRALFIDKKASKK